MRAATQRSSAAALLALACASAWSQPATADPTEGAIKLDPAKAEALHGGRLLLVEGQAAPGKAARFSLEGLFVMQPVVVSVQTRPAVAGVALAALKPFAKTPAKTVVTDAQGRASLSFRVQGDALLQVDARDTSAPYQLMVWVGPELRPPMPSPFKPAGAEALRNAPKARP